MAMAVWWYCSNQDWGSDDHNVVGSVLLETLDQLLLPLEELRLLPGLDDQPDLLLDESAKLLHYARVQVPGVTKDDTLDEADMKKSK